jgi:hypothetical protein
MRRPSRRLPLFSLAPLAALVALSAVTPGCLDRQVVPIASCSSGASVQHVRIGGVSKLDLLIMVDGSSSMSDKQSELSRRVPALIRALTAPEKNAAGDLVPRVRDLHVAVISSNLGSYGTAACDVATYGKHQDDRAGMLPRAGENGTAAYYVDAAGTEPKSAACPTPVAGAPITWSWTGDVGSRFEGEAGAIEAQQAVSCAVQSVRDDGCGYEAQLESIYRFLVDPAPPRSSAVACTIASNGTDSCPATGKIVSTGVDTELLAQRARFLRPDSELAVLMLTDENDASLHPTGQYWIPWASTHMQRAWGACAGAPDDVEPESGDEIAALKSAYGCQSCLQGGADPSGNCTKPWPSAGPDLDADDRNLRAFHQVQRFGLSFLWGRQRYVDAFSAATVIGSDGKLAPNPIYAGGVRTKDTVFVGAIVGAPTRLVQNADGTPKSTVTEDDWAKLVSADLTLRDPHMIESIGPRTGVSVFAGDRTIDADNGGDRHVAGGNDLQYACIGKRSVASPTGDCSGASAAGNPLCAKDASGASTQPYFKAYPGLRELRVMHDLALAKVPTLAASICADSYASILDGMFTQVAKGLEEGGECLATPLTVDAATGSVPCTLVEVFAGASVDGHARCEEISHDQGGYCTPGAAPCRTEPLSTDAAAAQLQLQLGVTHADGTYAVEMVQGAVAADGNVYAETSDGRRHLVCETRQLAADPAISDADKQACKSDAAFTLQGTAGGGWCYSTEPSIVGAKCEAKGATGKIRFFGSVQPHPGSDLFRVCLTGTCG